MFQRGELEISIISLIVNAFNLAIIILFLYNFAQMKQKNVGFIMVLTLSIVDMLFPIQNTLAIFFSQSSSASLWASVNSFTYHFGLYWSVIIALFVYLIYKGHGPFNFKVFVAWGFACSFSLAVLTTLV